MQFLNPRCSAALKKAGPIVDKLAPKFRETLKFLKKIRKFQGLPEIWGPTCLVWDPLFLVQLNMMN